MMQRSSVSTKPSSREIIQEAATLYHWHIDENLKELGVDHFTKGRRFVEVIYDRRGRVNHVRIGGPTVPSFHMKIEKHTRDTVLDELER